MRALSCRATARLPPIWKQQANKVENKMCDKCEDLKDALWRILQWAEAYPIDIFQEPTSEQCRRAHELLKTEGMTLDAFSAKMGRHCMSGVGQIASDALAKHALPE